MILYHPKARHGVRGRTGSRVFLPESLTQPPRQVLCRSEHFPKADRTMWVKIATGLAVLAGSWIAIYAFKPDSWRFIALYVFGGLAQTFLLLNIAHDSNHNAISSMPSVNKTRTMCLIFVESLVHVAYPPPSRPPFLR